MKYSRMMKRVVLGSALAAVCTWQAVAGITNAPDYIKSFETTQDPAYTNGYWLPVDGSEGWYAPEEDALAIEATTYAYDGGSYPLATNHTQVLKFSSDATNMVESSESAVVWIDHMIQPVAWEEETNPTVPDDAHMAYYLNTNGKFVVYSKDPVSDTQTWAEISSPSIASSDWVRVTVEIDYAVVTDFGSQFVGERKFRFLVNGAAVSNSLNATYGTDFAIASDSAAMSGLVFNGTGMLDDLQVVEGTNPLDSEYVTVRATAGMGGTTDPMGDTSVMSGSDLGVTVNADEGYYISGVSSNGTPLTLPEGTNEFLVALANITAAQTVIASFAEEGGFLIQASAGPNGSITPSGDVQVPSGSNQLFTITAATNYTVVSVLVDGVEAGAVTSYEFPSVSSNHTIEASFDYAYTSDGIPHWWISQFGIEANDNASTNDVDGDGEDLYNEWLKSTNPNDADSYLQTTPWAMGGTNYIQWLSPAIDPALPGFIIMGSSNLNDTAGWMPLESDVPRAETNIWFYTPGGSGPIFFRVAVTNAP